MTSRISRPARIDAPSGRLSIAPEHAGPERSRAAKLARAQAIGEGGACMEMAYREQWEAEIAEMRRVLGGLGMKEECKWGKPTYTVDGKNVVIMQGFKEYFALGFFQGALLKDPEKVLVQLGQTQAGRVMKFTSAKNIKACFIFIRILRRGGHTQDGEGNGFLPSARDLSECANRPSRSRPPARG